MLLLFPNFSQRRMSQSYVFSFSTSRFWFLLCFHTTCVQLKWLTNATKQHQLFNKSPLQVGEEKLKEGKRLSLYYWQERIIIDEDFKKSVVTWRCHTLVHDIRLCGKILHAVGQRRMYSHTEGNLGSILCELSCA